MTSSAREQGIAQLTAEIVRIERQVKALKDDDAGLELDDKVCKLMQENPAAFMTYLIERYPGQKEYTPGYLDALDFVLTTDEGLASRYAASFGVQKLSPQQARTFAIEDDAEDPGKEVDRLASQLQREHPEWTYEQCLDGVRESHPELWKRYAGR